MNLPDCRAYEQVSPVNKRGNPVMPASAPLTKNPGWASADGDTVLFNVAGGPATDNAARGTALPQVAERTAGGWVNRPAANGPAPQATVDAQNSSMRFQIPSADSKSLLFTSGSPFTPDNPYIEARANGSVNLARGSAVDWLSKPTWSGTSPAPGHLPLTFDKFMPVGGSPDLSTSYFMSRATLTPEDGTSGRIADLNTGSPTPGSSWALYRWKNGQLSNAGVLPPGSGYPDGLDPGGSVAAGLAAGAQPATAAGNQGMVTQNSYTHSVSPDGSAVLFVSPDPKAATGRPSQLYLARDGQDTVQLSTWMGTGTAPTGTPAGVTVAGGIGASPPTSGPSPISTSMGNVYAVASQDQRVVVFSTTDALTDGAPTDASIVKTYRYAAAGGGALTYMPDLDRAVDTDGPIFNISDDGSRILYRTAAGALLLWRTEDPDHPITLGTGVGPTRSATGGISESRFSNDGRTLMLMSRVPLRGEPNHPSQAQTTSPPGAGTSVPSQVYRYTEADDRLDCVSCPPPSVTPKGPATFTLQGINNGFAATTTTLSLAPSRGMTDDGKTVFFTTTSPLSPDDHNATADVYEWRAEVGRPELLSSGAPTSAGDLLIDNNATGSDVFIASRGKLTPSDTDNLYDLYDVRIDGGLVPPAKPIVPCDGDACQGQLPQPHGPFTDAGSAAFVGGGNMMPPAEEPAKIRVSKVKTVRGTSTKVKVKVPGKGKIRTSGSGLRRGHKTAKKAGTYRVTVKLSKRSRRTLARKHRVKVRVTVRFTPSKGKTQRTRVSVTFKPKTHKKKSSSRSVRRAPVLSSASGKGR